MSSEAIIVNHALQMIKNTRRIVELSENSKEAHVASEIYAEIRDELLELHNWNFATTRAQLARLVETPAFGFDYMYELPADCLRVSKVSASSEERAAGLKAFRIEGRAILTSETEVFLKYIKVVEDPNLMTPTFRTAFSRKLASRMATSLGQSARAAEAHETRFDDVELPRAKSADAIPDGPEQLPESSWITARHGQIGDVRPGDPPA